MNLKMIFIIPLFFTFSVLPQNVIKGKVVDASDNNPLNGATISLGSSGATTDKNGAFSISCSKSTELLISFVGHETFRYLVKNCNEDLSVTLVPTLKNLNNVEIITTSNTGRSILYQPVSVARLS